MRRRIIVKRSEPIPPGAEYITNEIKNGKEYLHFWIKEDEPKKVDKEIKTNLRK